MVVSGRLALLPFSKAILGVFVWVVLLNRQQTRPLHLVPARLGSTKFRFTNWKDLGIVTRCGSRYVFAKVARRIEFCCVKLSIVFGKI